MSPHEMAVEGQRLQQVGEAMERRAFALQRAAALLACCEGLGRSARAQFRADHEARAWALLEELVKLGAY